MPDLSRINPSYWDILLRILYIRRGHKTRINPKMKHIHGRQIERKGPMEQGKQDGATTKLILIVLSPALRDGLRRKLCPG